MNAGLPSLEEFPVKGLARCLAIAGFLFLITFDAQAQTAAASNSGPICTGADVMLYETGGSAVSWVWSTSGRATFNNNTLQSPTARGAVNGEIFSVTVTDANNNKATASTTVVVYSNPPARPGQISGNTSPCQGAMGIGYSVSPVANTTSYLWEVPAGWLITAGQGTVSITVTVGMSLQQGTVRVSGVNSCGTSEHRNRNVSVSPVPAAAGTITGTSSVCAGQSGVSFSVASISNATSYAWSFSGTGATITNGTTNTITISFAANATTGNLTVQGVNTCGNGTASAPYLITVNQLPVPAGVITGPETFTPGTTGISYSIASIPGSTGYQWGYTGTGVTIIGSGSSVTLDFSVSASPGQLSVRGTNACGQGTASTLDLSPSIRTLTMTSVFLEGLYNAGGTMRQAIGDSGPRWGAGIADHITVELHNTTSYATIVWSANDIPLSISGTAVVTVPAVNNGSYYVTVKHRNSIETTTGSPVSFAGTVINILFGSTTSVYGSNLKASGDGYFLIFGGDVNQDGFVDSGDYPDVVNGNFNYLTGYLPADINGDGFIDSGDYPIMVNNNFKYVRTIHP